ncbi:MAG: hypothetical protein ABH887_00670 [bacterium]
MTLDNIKAILKKEGGKCILMDEDKDSYLVVELRKVNSANATQREDVSASNENIEKVNRDIDELKALEEDDIEEVIEEDSKELKIEDLPF